MKTINQYLTQLGELVGDDKRDVFASLDLTKLHCKLTHLRVCFGGNTKIEPEEGSELDNLIKKYLS